MSGQCGVATASVPPHVETLFENDSGLATLKTVILLTTISVKENLGILKTA